MFSFCRIAIAGMIMFCITVTGLVFQTGNSYASAPPVRVDYKVIDSASVTAYLPFVYGMTDKKMEAAINAMLSKDSTNTLNNWQKNWQEMYNAASPATRDGLHLWLSFQQNMNRNNILSMTLSEYSYTGGAHGMYFQYARNIDLLTGKDIQLDSLFKTDAGWKRLVDDFIREDIKRYQRELNFTGIRDNQSYYLANEGIVIFFNPYEIGTWADGTIEFVIPYRVISFMFDKAYAERIF